MVVLDWIPHLKVSESNDLIDEYRVQAGRVEVRALDPNGDPYPGYSDWIQLTPEEIRMHFIKRTPIAEWLKDVLNKGRSADLKRPLAG